jgi:hypothetical protein
MISETSISNSALAMLGAKQIESLEEPSRAAEFCRNKYPFLRDAVLEDGDWGFATQTLVLGPSTNTPDWDDSLFIHELPLDWISVREITTENQHRLEWELQGRQIFAPESTVVARGIRRITDTGKFTPLFVEALATRLAYDLAIPIAGDKVLRRELMMTYQDHIAAAEGADRQQNSKPRYEESSVVDARFHDHNIAPWRRGR